ncbi:TetR/AcrR family transcriptional regulator [Streptomyces sp. NRRL F-5755]|uniref:TetR/AcrR family transcriptional regulator n=1 Tax=Streptomyces sp. NRRL F-5755 TaxID=1519475 RepID=UPI0006ADB5EE|nr:TetR/AcrR family transcriptional regulator [Streptomyces sp. NRRL F-5755]
MDVRKSSAADRPAGRDAARQHRVAHPRTTQADRRARTRAALLESAARGLSRYGYGNLRLEQVAQDAGYTRGALYHQFTGKQDLTLAVTEWVLDTWWQEVGVFVERAPDPIAALLTLARGHAVYCRRDIARVAMALRLEFAGQDHPVGRAVEQGYRDLLDRCTALIEAAREAGAIPDTPDGPPAGTLALAFVGAIEGTSIALSGHAPHDAPLVARAATGALGLTYDPGEHTDPGRTAHRRTIRRETS